MVKRNQLSRLAELLECDLYEIIPRIELVNPSLNFQTTLTNADTMRLLLRIEKFLNKAHKLKGKNISILQEPLYYLQYNLISSSDPILIYYIDDTGVSYTVNKKEKIPIDRRCGFYAFFEKGFLYLSECNSNSNVLTIILPGLQEPGNVIFCVHQWGGTWIYDTTFYLPKTHHQKLKPNNYI